VTVPPETTTVLVVVSTDTMVSFAVLPFVGVGLPSVACVRTSMNMSSSRKCASSTTSDVAALAAVVRVASVPEPSPYT
jgi:hypothetical protein